MPERPKPEARRAEAGVGFLSRGQGAASPFPKLPPSPPARESGGAL